MTKYRFYVDEGESVEGMKTGCQARKLNPGFPSFVAEVPLKHGCTLDDAIVAVYEALPPEVDPISEESHCEINDALRAPRIGLCCSRPIGRPDVGPGSGADQTSILTTRGHTYAKIKRAIPSRYASSRRA